MLSELLQRAENNDVEALIALSEIYGKGEGVEQDFCKKAEYLQRAAALGSSEAMIRLSICYENGEGVEKDDSKVFELANIVFSKKDAVSLRGALRLAQCYLEGIGTEVNAESALFFTSLLLGVNHDPAGLCSIYYDDAVKMLDSKSYVDWLIKTSEALPYAKFKLGELYEEGEILDYDEDLAIEWYTKSANEGCIDAKMNLAILYKKSEIAQNLTIAENLLKEVINADYKPEELRAKRLLGMLYTETNRKEAGIKIFEELVEKFDDALSCSFIGLEYNERKEYETARQYFVKSYEMSGDQKYKDMINAVDKVIRLSNDDSGETKSSGGCYVATAVYGSYDCPQVWTLRRFRDNTLDANIFGRMFIKLYYAVSPTLVKYFGKTKLFRKIFKSRLDKMVEKLNNNGVENSPYNDKY
ncbi:MAG: sel1 repeat family protein [Clostridia bacterium]|nr:sel1 repeat family protein [Clostridia bacterium]MBO5433766.1 sel1 repeat family protein [Clostridia bacterium]